MGNRASASEADRAQEEVLRVYQARLRLWREVLAGMDAAEVEDAERRMQIGCCRSFGLWLQCLGALIELPIYLLLHMLQYTVYLLIVVALRLVLMVVQVCCAWKVCVGKAMEAARREDRGKKELDRLRWGCGAVMCVGRNWYLQYAMLMSYWTMSCVVLAAVFLPCDLSHIYRTFYGDVVVNFDRPVEPIPPNHTAARSMGDRSGSCLDCCSCAPCLASCRRALFQGGRTAQRQLSPLGQAGEFEERFLRSLFFSFSGFTACHPARLMGPCCLCCRNCYRDYDTRGRAWAEQRAVLRFRRTTEFYQSNYGADNFADVEIARGLVEKPGAGGGDMLPPGKESIDRPSDAKPYGTEAVEASGQGESKATEVVGFTDVTPTIPTAPPEDAPESQGFLGALLHSLTPAADVPTRHPGSRIVLAEPVSDYNPDVVDIEAQVHDPDTHPPPSATAYGATLREDFNDHLAQGAQTYNKAN